MRVLALDYGSARCGCAVSDPTGTLATPIEAVERPDTKRGMNRIVGLVREHAVKQVVVGLPVGLSGGDTQQTMAARDFADRLGKRVRVPVDLYDERFTTSIAAARGGAGSEDSRAAAVMLEDYLARHA